MKKTPAQSLIFSSPAFPDCYTGIQAGILPLPSLQQERAERKSALRRFTLELNLMMAIISFLGWCLPGNRLLQSDGLRFL